MIIGVDRARCGSMPLTITSLPVELRSVVTSACWKSTGDASATPGVLQIRNEKFGSEAAFVQARSLETMKPQDSGKLVFNRYGDTYFLNQVWSDVFSYSLPKSQSEISLSNELAAENPPDLIPVVVVVSLQ